MSRLTTDPREGVNDLDDTSPILLMPVRLETRFTKDPELLVRIYPDDCNISTFDEALTPSEVDNVRRYWTEVREAGTAEAPQRAAWRRLVAAHGSGRATWLRAVHQPVNPSGPPDFPEVSTKQDAWAQAPRVLLMPQRFVVIGFRAGEDPLVEVGAEVDRELFAGPDPSATGEDQLHHDERGNLVMPDRLRWLSDFDRAVEVGMGLRIPLTKEQAQGGFDRLLVLGVRIGSDAEQGAAQFGDLLRRHAHSRAGVAVVARGTPTNNSEDADSGYGRRDDPDASFDDLREPAYDVTAESGEKRDGQWMAEYLGLSADFFVHTHGAAETDSLTSRAMNTLLWPATFGHWMRAMMGEVFGEGDTDDLGEFFVGHVLGGGVVPAMRIGAQPYGILPATAFSRLEWPGHDADVNKVAGPLYNVLDTIRQDWTPLVERVARIGGPSDDAHQTLLDVLALHPGSVEWSQRYAESLTTLLNRLNLRGLAGWIQQIKSAAERAAAQELLAHHGYGGTGAPPILDLVFSSRQNLLTGGVVDGLPPSETAPLRPSTVDGRNYLSWLASAARGGLDRLYDQDDFVDDRPPASLLYLMARHALQLGYHEAGVRSYQAAGLYTPAQARAARTDNPILHISTGASLSESRYQPLFAAVEPITGHPTRRVADHITMTLGSPQSAELAAQLDALARLENVPTAQLERAFADHVDTCSYRLDAWLLGLVDLQLTRMREQRPTGLHLGAYGLVEDLRPGRSERFDFVPEDKDVAEDFKEGPLTVDPANQGFVHTPSLNHAVAAAVLRNGYLSGAAPGEGPAVDLSSARVRAALALVNGVRAGQSLSDLLGYQFERGLHDRHGLAEVDGFILPLRKEFPLRADRMASTRTGDGVPIEAIEAGNVLDGLALVNRLRTAGGYPFGATGLPVASAAQRAAINAEAHRLLDTHDAVADLALAEGVYQAVMGNYDRVASTYDAYAKGRSPAEPDIVRTPSSGVTLTHRVALHLPPTATPGPGATPRARIEPSVDAWLAEVLPPLDEVGCMVSFRSAGTGTETVREVTLASLGLRPADLVAIGRVESLSELDDRVRRFVRATFDPRPDQPIAIDHQQAAAGRVSVFELLPMLTAARRLVTLSRPLTGNDLRVTAGARAGDEPAPFIDRRRVDAVDSALRAVRSELATVADAPTGPDPAFDVDEQVESAVDALARAASFGLAQAGWDFAYEGLGLAYAELLAACAETAGRCGDRLDRFAEEFARYQAVPAAGSDEERFLFLGRAEAAISTAPIQPRPATPAAFAAALQAGPVADLEAARIRYQAVAASTRTTAWGLHSDIMAIPPAAPVDLAAPNLTPAEDRLIQLLVDTRSVLLTVLAEADRRLAASAAALDKHDGATSPAERVAALQEAAKALLGDECLLIPEFTVDGQSAGQVSAALTASRSGAPYTHLDVDFPVDTWLHSTARVRERLHDWEQLQLLAGAFGRPEPEFDALQLPPVAGEGWLGLDIRPDQVVDSDRLLYTAHLPAGVVPGGPQRGLLLDEWTETIPSSTAESGIAFHSDRPNTEAPQAMLLVTPTLTRGAWKWDDLVDAVCDTIDLARLRALEPRHIGELPYASFLPATLMASQVRQLTIAADLALNNVLANVKAQS
ncbi:hypothetical protein [Streptosporangium sp. CA-115845]|uniref:hypothetical protein n=1 Tax=Streptosporangium sp. CA-115845 TaxID=3240071 RepID=UPI003D949B80